ncbi:MAG: glycosyltransferase [Ignavibacteriales bacterium]|nr:glycosyltransferase [Ignavibacteriales bacterium]
MELQVLFLSALLILFAAYATIHLLAKRGLNHIAFVPQIAHPSISIVIAARNEEKNIARCLQSLLDQEYPKDRFEIIVVNDRSDDMTGHVVSSLLEANRNLRLITITEIDPEMPPKKNALRKGIKTSRYEILAFTDADCIVPPEWLSTIASAFSQEVGVVAGYSPFELPRSGVWPAFLRYEELKNSIGAAAAIGWQKGYMCTGRSFAYRREVYDAVGGFESIKKSISGDDDLFLQRVEREKRWEMRYLSLPHVAVITEAPASFGQFINQRTRHFSTGKYYPLRMKLIFGCLHGFNFLLLPAFIFIPDVAAALLLMKLAIDSWIVDSGRKLFGETFSFGQFLLSEFFYVCYNLLIGPLGVFGNFTWKGSPKR